MWISLSLRVIAGQAHGKTGVAGFGGESDIAFVFE
jgi:hypothetical protein